MKKHLLSIVALAAMTLVSQSVSAQDVTYDFVGAASAAKEIKKGISSQSAGKQQKYWVYEKMELTESNNNRNNNLNGYKPLTAADASAFGLQEYCNVWFRQLRFDNSTVTGANGWSADGFYTGKTTNAYFVLDSLNNGDKVTITYKNVKSTPVELLYATDNEKIGVSAQLTSKESKVISLVKGVAVPSGQPLEVSTEAENVYLQFYPADSTYIQKIEIVGADGAVATYDFEVAGKKFNEVKYEIKNQNANQSKGTAYYANYYYFESDANPSATRNMWRFYKFNDEDSKAFYTQFLPEEQHVVLATESFANSIFVYGEGLQIDDTKNRYIAIEGLNTGSKVQVIFTGINGTDSLLYATGTDAEVKAAIGNQLVAGVDSVGSGQEIFISKAGAGYIVLKPIKGMIIQKINIWYGDETSAKVYDFNKEWLAQEPKADGSDMKGDFQLQQSVEDNSTNVFYLYGKEEGVTDFRTYSNAKVLPAGIYVRGVRPVVSGLYDNSADDFDADVLAEEEDGTYGYLKLGDAAHEVAITGLKSGNIVMFNSENDLDYVTGEAAGAVAEIGGEELVAGESTIKSGDLIDITEAGEGYIIVKATGAIYQIYVFQGTATDDDDPTTGIQTITNAPADGAWYTIQGLRVAQPTKGLYIHNGKKVVIK